jgi:hypothetical protein
MLHFRCWNFYNFPFSLLLVLQRNTAHFPSSVGTSQLFTTQVLFKLLLSHQLPLLQSWWQYAKRQFFLDRNQSNVSICHHPLCNISLWIIPYWTEGLELCTTSWKAWVKAEEFLQKRKRVWKKSVSRHSADEVMQQAYDVLLYLPWLGNICGFDNDEPLYKLALYTSREWLTTTHQDQMLDLLQCDLLLKGSKVEIENIAFFAKLQQGYDCHDMDVYDESRAFACPRGVVLALEVGECDGLGLEINIEGDHWVSAVLDFKNSVIYYGDPLNGDPTDKVQSVLNWWTFHHTGSLRTKSSRSLSRGMVFHVVC